MLTDDLFRDAVLWGRQEGGEDRSSVGWQTRTVIMHGHITYMVRTEDIYTSTEYRRRDPHSWALLFLLRNKPLFS